MSGDRRPLTRIVNPEALGRPVGYSNGVAVEGGTLVFVAGQVAWDRDHRIVSDRLARQFGQALANVLEVVRAAGGDATSVAKLTVFVASTAEYEAELKAIGAEYRQIMGRHFPAMSLVEIQGLLEPGAKVEIEAVAMVPTTATMATTGPPPPTP